MSLDRITLQNDCIILAGGLIFTFSLITLWIYNLAHDQNIVAAILFLCLLFLIAFGMGLAFVNTISELRAGKRNGR